MRAVDLRPADVRAGAGRAGLGSNALIGGLVVLVFAVAALVLASNSVKENRAKVAAVDVRVQAAEARAQALAPYVRFAELKRKRIETVSSLASTRFDWERTLRELSRVLPSDVWLSNLSASVSTEAGVASAGETGAMRGALPQNPAMEIVGCTRSHSDVARLVTRLKLIDRVRRVTLSASEKSDSGAGAGSSGQAAGGGGSSDCRYGSGKFPRFALVIFFEQPPAPAAAPGTAAATPAAQEVPAG